MIVRNHSVWAVARTFNAGEIRFSWALSKRGVPNGVVDLEQEGRKVVVKTSKGPGRLSDRCIALRDLTDVARDLSVAAKVVNKLSVRGAVMWPSQLCGPELRAVLFFDGSRGVCTT